MINAKPANTLIILTILVCLADLIAVLATMPSNVRLVTQQSVLWLETIVFLLMVSMNQI